MRVAFAVAGVILLPACSEGFLPREPSEQTVDRLERRLVELPCVGKLERWERHYTFDSKPLAGGLFGWRNRWYDYRKIDIDLREAGFEEFKGGRHLHSRRPEHQSWADDRGYLLAFGKYDIATDRLKLRHCGPN